MTTPESVRARLTAKTDWPVDEDPLVEARAEARVELAFEQLLADADTHYDAEDRGWFHRLPTEDLACLWSLCCTPGGAAWDDEVYEALFARDYFKEA